MIRYVKRFRFQKSCPNHLTQNKRARWHTEIVVSVSCADRPRTCSVKTHANTGITLVRDVLLFNVHFNWCGVISDTTEFYQDCPTKSAAGKSFRVFMSMNHKKDYYLVLEMKLWFITLYMRVYACNPYDVLHFRGWLHTSANINFLWPDITTYWKNKIKGQNVITWQERTRGLIQYKDVVFPV